MKCGVLCCGYAGCAGVHAGLTGALFTSYWVVGRVPIVPSMSGVSAGDEVERPVAAWANKDKAE